MSTKSTIWHGNGLHLYFDHADGFVYLSIVSGPFACVIELQPELLKAIMKSPECCDAVNKA